MPTNLHCTVLQMVICTCIFIERNLKRGECVFRQKGNLVATSWQDKKQVTVLSTNCQPTGSTTVMRRQKDGQKESVPCPPNVVAYNKYMGGVDKCDQLRGYYRVRVKSKKCYKYIFWFLFDCSIVNSFTLVKHYSPITDSSRHTVIKTFRQKLAMQLIGEYNSRQRYSLPAPIQAACHDSTVPPAKRQRTGAVGSEGHYPFKGPKSRCFWCWNYKNQRRHDSAYHCRRCGKAFCLISRDAPEGPSCFEQYHTLA